ncbi:Uma2 family endonuclease [Streptomyces niveus]|uniref:Uma2 family endonuclease n=1 Tax=Streptomyces niveus TaxID=193462 RepID=A0ABZ2A6S9_STRNV|nr:Uma2 family endonuclease [Streptomyces niveus]WTA59866.1 Uma2 family endonuclease [Streptomyces niveus]
MTPSSTEDAQMSVTEFEQIAHHTPETVTLEFINGKLEVKQVPDGDHGTIIVWLMRQCMQQRPELDLYGEQGLKIESYRQGRARPDGALVPRRHFAGKGEWSDPDGVLMVAEVTSYDGDTDSRDRREKRDGYAAAGIPVYLLVDRDSNELIVYTNPHKGAYKARTTHAYGAAVTLPDPVGITLDTDELKDYAR